MFQNFSGSSRRPRQVNLSGRNSNPWATTSQTAGPSAVENAQQERERRQLERDRQNAAKVIQGSWRRSQSRKRLHSNLRQEFDEIESDGGPADGAVEAEQLDRLLQFLDYRDDEDLQRLARFSAKHMDHVQNGHWTDPSAGPWPMLYLRLERATLEILERSSTSKNDNPAGVETQLRILDFLTAVGSHRGMLRSLRYYQVIRDVTVMSIQQGRLNNQQLINNITSPLRKLSGGTIDSYEAFGCRYLLCSHLLGSTFLQLILPQVANGVNYKLLASALSSVLSSANFHAHLELANSTSRLSLLCFFIYFHRHAHNFASPETYSSDPDFVTVVSTLLGSIADDFDMDEPEEPLLYNRRSQVQKTPILEPFCREQLLSLKEQSSVGSLLGSIEPPSGSGPMKADARQLATYALSLLRFFPRSGDDIRLSLFRGSSASTIPSIKYFFEASRNTHVFQEIYKDHKAAIQFLKGPMTSSARLYQPPSDLPIASIPKIQDDWKVLLVFFELYSFVLKVMDDDEFFSASERSLINPAPGETSSLRANALPLDSIKDLTIFLKNLGFTMIYNALDITDSATRDAEPASLSSLFRPQVGAPISPAKANFENPKPVASVPSVGGISGMSIDYVKGLVTGLMRMIYERDSRRKFLPQNHWLLSSRVLLEGFERDVVLEEEKRATLQDQDDEDLESNDDALGSDINITGESRTRQIRAQLRSEQEQKRASRKRYLQAVAPRLEILQNMPFVIPFQTRVQIFREFVLMDMKKRRHGMVDADMWRNMMMAQPDSETRMAPYHAYIRRGHEFEDAYNNLDQLKDNIKEPVQIGFIDRFGQMEAGIDGGGVTKEFLTSVTQEAFNPTDDDQVQMFLENDHHLLYPNPAALDEMREQTVAMMSDMNPVVLRTKMADFLRRFEFLGRIVGKCLYEGILVDINFAGFFLRKWALTGGEGSAPNESGYRASINDLRDLDEALYQGLLKLKRYTGTVEDFALDFTIADTIKLPATITNSHPTKTISKNLRPNGDKIPVTNENRLIYIALVAQHRLTNQPFQQTMAFLRGLSSMIQPSWLSMFNQSELQTLVGGTAASISIPDLKANTQYGGVYAIGDDDRLHPTIELFWRVMEGFEDGERRAVLKFVTSTPNAPLLGFGSLNPRFSVRDSGDDQSRLPSTSTCVNLLKLPRYEDEGVMRDKLLYAAFSGAGFDLS